MCTECKDVTSANQLYEVHILFVYDSANTGKSDSHYVDDQLMLLASPASLVAETTMAEYGWSLLVPTDTVMHL